MLIEILPSALIAAAILYTSWNATRKAFQSHERQLEKYEEQLEKNTRHISAQILLNVSDAMRNNYSKYLDKFLDCKNVDDYKVTKDRHNLERVLNLLELTVRFEKQDLVIANQLSSMYEAVFDKMKELDIFEKYFSDEKRYPELKRFLYSAD